MATFFEETVLSLHHWNERVFSFSTTRNASFRFENGQFVMIGLQQEHRPLARAYSIASANHEPVLEFLSIKVPDGPFTSRLQDLRPGDSILVGRKPTGTLLLDDLRPGRVLYLLGSGTGLAPFLSIIKSPEAYERFEKVVLVHSVRCRTELAYRDFIEWDLTQDEYLGEQVTAQLHYYPTVTRQRFRHQGRITTLIGEGRVQADLRLPPLDCKLDRAMICGSPAMLADVSAVLDARGFHLSKGIGHAGDYVIERAFVDK